MASLYTYSKNENAILLVAPSDHVISDSNHLHNAILSAMSTLKNGKIITFGVKPTHPETGYGYIELENISLDKVSKVLNFKEKPELCEAKKMFSQGNFFWNSGMFLFRAKDMISAFNKHASYLISPIKASLKKARLDLGFLWLDQDSWSSCRNISIDYAIMEKIDSLSAIVLKSNWSDLGDWKGVWDNMGPDKNGVSLSSNAYQLRCKNTLIRSEDKKRIIFGLGLKDLMIIATSDAVLVANKNLAQEVKEVVNNLKSKNISQAENFYKTHKPWGWFESLILAEDYQVKKIFIKPGAAISLQSHKHRSEHWVIVKGTAKVTLKTKVKLLKEGESIFIPIGSKHRIENPGKASIILIEVQTGTYLGEDDIIRYEDLYSRK